ncbi:[Protein-PII]-UMP uridylyl-removing enzyme / [Protein-PII] uridylyltransferase [Methylacidimicrobium sp. AP8]|uniref:[protein-PII] uridylyltransferase n=1 Tax=Methylacidimicrobium sp. AP8 TaxID=2730359 RepID=UPI0018C09B08|nr:[protein-PII] uridylyltransferase [Methylacidimicrobium sp. AP8]CAB4243453.1 [Protein-PII]-UMP uridylyl-removing enzyme / [Protein-PII] uridylyltransferase [Methylacidimicrobium sp. AP8]
MVVGKPDKEILPDPVAPFLKPLEKALREAEREQLSGERRIADRAAFYRQFLRKQLHILRTEHSLGAGGRVRARRQAALLTALLRHLWGSIVERLFRTAEDVPPLLLAAVGGFGRGELCPYSDVDLLFLSGPCSRDEEERVAEIVQQVLYTLWDIGLQVGHSTRQIEDTVDYANQDLRTKTSLLEARLIAGPPALWKEFQALFENRCLRGREEEYVEWRMVDQQMRHAKYGGTVLVQEPHIKNGCGSLRDYQNLFWVLRVREGIGTTDHLVKSGRLEAKEGERLEEAYDFLLRVRAEMHYIEKRPSDLLTLGLQAKVAGGLRYPGPNLLRRIEECMRDYYRRAYVIYQLANLVFDSLAKSKRACSAVTDRDRQFIEDFPLVDGKLEVPPRRRLRENPLGILKAFVLAARHDVGIGPGLAIEITRTLPLLRGALLQRKEVREMLLLLLSSKGRVGRVLRQMHELGLLGRLVPEFAPLTCLVQHEFYHRYTADEHTLRCLEMLDRIWTDPDAPFAAYRPILESVERPYLLPLAILLHDTGRATNRRHHAEESATNAMRVAKRLRLSPRDLATVVFLVSNHLLMWQTALRRDLDEEETVEEFCKIVATQERLDLLMVLTFVDGEGTAGTDAWSSWKDLLLWRLYRSASAHFGRAIAAEGGPKQSREEIAKQMRERPPPEVSLEEVDAHFEHLPKSYFLRCPEDRIRRHLSVIHRFLYQQVVAVEPMLCPVVDWVDVPAQGYSEVIVVTWDRARVFARICGGFAALGVSILSAEVYSRSDGIAIDTFWVCLPDGLVADADRYLAPFSRLLDNAFSVEEFDFSPLVEKQFDRLPEWMRQAEFPTRIHFDLTSSKHFTILDLETPDRPGLLYRIASSLAAAGIDVASARIATEKGAALDTFYLRKAGGGKLEDEKEIERVTRRLRKAMGV